LTSTERALVQSSASGSDLTMAKAWAVDQVELGEIRADSAPGTPEQGKVRPIPSTFQSSDPSSFIPQPSSLSVSTCGQTPAPRTPWRNG
jgi:hypothetical protein